MARSLWVNVWRMQPLAPDYKINDVGLGFVLKCFSRGSYAVEQEGELDKNIDYRCHEESART